MMFLNLYLINVGQKSGFFQNIDFNASFSKDSVLMNDTLDIHIYFKNNSDEIVKLHPKGFLCILPDVSMFITYESTNRMMYIVNNFCDYESVVLLKPQEEFKYTLSIKANADFFYNGLNSIFVFYRFPCTSLKDKAQREYDKKQKDKYKEEVLLLSSPKFTINVY